jgi:hypothetical protein
MEMGFINSQFLLFLYYTVEGLLERKLVTMWSKVLQEICSQDTTLDATCQRLSIEKG